MADITSAAPPPAWTRDAACIDYPPDWWYATRGEQLRAAKAICAGCPVRAQCLDAADGEGIWGGLTTYERRTGERMATECNVDGCDRPPRPWGGSGPPPVKCLVHGRARARKGNAA